VVDPFGVTADAAMPSLARALDPVAVHDAMRAHFAHHPRYAGASLAAIFVRRYKPGRRCVLEYRLHLANGSPEAWIGKVRHQRTGRKDHALASAIHAAGFDCHSPDRIATPQPLAYLKPLRLWLQRKVDGCEASSMLSGRHAVALATRVADAAYKLHRAGVPPRRVHTLRDELDILQLRLALVAAAQPRWRSRIQALLRQAEQVAETLPAAAHCGIHRDFYADQVIVNGDRLWLLDFDLYCGGDPTLDIGNFVAHITEQALRCHGNAAALQQVEQALIERYLARAGKPWRHHIEVYTWLTLLRHVQLSTQHLDRLHTTGALIDLCEDRARALQQQRFG
jgi:thiamine kinase-like enzyme